MFAENSEADDATTSDAPANENAGGVRGSTVGARDRPERPGGRAEGAGGQETAPGTWAESSGDSAGRSRPSEAGTPPSTSSGSPVAHEALRGAGVVVTYLVTGVAIGVSGVLLLNLFGGSLGFFAPRPAVLGFAAVTFLALVGPAVGGPVALWMHHRSDHGQLATGSAAVSNAVGHFLAASVGSFLLAFEFAGLQLVDLFVPFLFAAGFTGVVAVAAGGVQEGIERVAP